MSDAKVIARRSLDGVVVEGVTGWDGDQVRSTIDLKTLAEHDDAVRAAGDSADPGPASDRQRWDLLLSVPGGPLTLARLLDDMYPRDRILIYPSREIASPGGKHSLRPYFTPCNTLAIDSQPAPETVGVAT